MDATVLTMGQVLEVLYLTAIIGLLASALFAVFSIIDIGVRLARNEGTKKMLVASEIIAIVAILFFGWMTLGGFNKYLDIVGALALRFWFIVGLTVINLYVIMLMHMFLVAYIEECKEAKEKIEDKQ